MDYDYSKMSAKEIGENLPKLTRRQIIELGRRIHHYLETSGLTRASETAFSEWEDSEENIYRRNIVL